ncbi:MAG: HzsA-related protein [Pirellulaceae bacterium]
MSITMQFGSATAALAAVLVSCGLASGTPPSPENLATQAQVTASSEYSSQYQAANSVDGQVPGALTRDDAGKAWCAKGLEHPDGVTLTFQWPQPVPVATVVYYGRTAFHLGENWKDYECYLNDATQPAVKGQLLAGHGPQAINLPAPTSTTKLTLKFLTSYGGPNPGSAEIQVYSADPPWAALGRFVPPAEVPGYSPDVAAFEPPPPIPESPELSARLASGALGFTKLIVAQRHHIGSTHVYTYHCEGQQNGGGLYVYDVTNGGLNQLVDATEGQIQSCDLSYDGQAILFGWRNRSAYYQLYSINVDGSDLRQLTDGEHHNYDGAWLPDGRIVFLSTRNSQAAYCFFTPVGILYTMQADGSNQQRISANYLNDFTPAVLNDGRIIYGRWEYVDRPAIPIQSLWTIHPDGTALKGFFGNRVLDPATFIEPQPMVGSESVLCTLTGHNGSCRGGIGIIDPRRGDNAQSSIRNLTPDVRLNGVDISSNGPGGPYQTPYPVDATYFLVSRDGTLLLRDYEGRQQTTVLTPRDLGFYNPRPLRPRPPPPVRLSQLPTEPKNADWAAVYVQDVYQGLMPQVQRGDVKQIAVVQELHRALIDSPGIQQPAFGYQRVLVSCGATYVPKKVWGFADVREDGSAYFQVPARQPIYFLALDAQGRAVQRMRSFTHLMPGEVQGCIGCHEPRNCAPLRSLSAAALGDPQPLREPEWGRQGFCYSRIVQPVLDKHCTECHNPMRKDKGVDLTGDRTDYFNVSYEVLARRNQGRTGSPFVNWIPSYNGEEWNILRITPKSWGSPVSRLADLILSGHPDENGQARVQLDDAARRRVLTWIDLNVPYYGTADTGHPELPACRQMFPPDLTRVLDDVYARRCEVCHTARQVAPLLTWRQPEWSGGLGPWGGMGVRIENPHLNDFLLAPLRKDAGGTEACGQPVFQDTSDPDYQAVLNTFAPTLELMRRRPRMDMANPVPSCLTTALAQ